MRCSVLVIFNNELPERGNRWWQQFHTVIAPRQLEESIDENLNFVDIDSLIEPSNIYKASAFLEELSNIKTPNGSRASQSFVYKGYELWWMHYSNLLLYFCLPYIEYRRLLEYVKDFDRVYFYNLPYPDLFSCYLNAYGRKAVIIRPWRVRINSILPLGIAIQTMLTLLYLPVFLIRKYPVLVFTSDKFEKGGDYDFRLKFIYRELRERDILFVEIIRSLESWRTVIRHAVKRNRPVIYSESVKKVSQFISIISGIRMRARGNLNIRELVSERNPEERFKLIVSVWHMRNIGDDIVAIHMMKLIIKIVGVKSAFFTAALDRNIHAFLGCKLLNIPTVGIQHGAAPKEYFVSDFMPGFEGEKPLSVDKYGLWSEWWLEYYQKNSRAYRPEQLYVSGPMRPFEKESDSPILSSRKKTGPIKVLFVPGEKSVPEEVMPYLLKLIEEEDISVYLTFRPYRDAFEDWLKSNHSHLIEKVGGDKIIPGNIHTAIAECDIVVGAYSTAVLEALLQAKPVTFFKTDKWGDCFELSSFESPYRLFVKNPPELIQHIKQNVTMSGEIIEELRKRFFGDPRQNGSKWVVDQIENTI